MQHLSKLLTLLLIPVKEIPQTLILTWVSIVLLKVSRHQRNRAISQSEKLHKLKQKKNVDFLRRISLPNLKKSAHHNSVVLGLSERGIVHKDLPFSFGGVPQVPDLKLHPSDEDEDLHMNCDASATCVPPSHTPTLS
ncbi:hypothetical protein AVEN_249237-1 [Araneus ventricosus]|uniref:Uncharacterized protein n=1 Tax=Araneus ventricosus TaxID=182803 RepID=A0A4Y2MJG9_ARAVE|nr:hypothetical protein AVEN_249237-1 [Araneus ventricosus]